MDVAENGNASPIGDFDTGNDDKPVGLRVSHNFKTISAYCMSYGIICLVTIALFPHFHWVINDQLNNNQKSPHISTFPLQQPPQKSNFFQDRSWMISTSYFQVSHFQIFILILICILYLFLPYLVKIGSNTTPTKKTTIHYFSKYLYLYLYWYLYPEDPCMEYLPTLTPKVI